MWFVWFSLEVEKGLEWGDGDGMITVVMVEGSILLSGFPILRV